MITVILTGGIGSGKTTVANMFKELGIPIYIADDEAKKLMTRSKVIKRQLIGLFGAHAYTKTGLDKAYLSKAIFNDKSLLQKMNAIVHPKVGRHYEKWLLKQDAPYALKEAAIVFENGSYKNYDYIVTVTAPKKVRLERVLKRDSKTKADIEAIMRNQWDDEAKVSLSHFVIYNVDLSATKKQVVEIHKNLIKTSYGLIPDKKF